MITQIIWLLTWPVLIAISWYAIKWVLKKSEKIESNYGKDAPEENSVI